MIELIKETEKIGFASIISEYSDMISQDEVKLDRAFKAWETSKERLFKELFYGEDLMFTIPIEAKQTAEEAVETFNSIFCLYGAKYYYLKEILKIFSIEDLMNNSFTGTIELPFCEKTFTFNGIRIMRAIRQIMKNTSIEAVAEYNKKVYGADHAWSGTIDYTPSFESDIQLIERRYSQFLQEVQVKDTVTLSIHPLDYLTISYNNNNWNSCHSPDGSYAAGNLSYMQDAVTVVAYLHSPKSPMVLDYHSGKEILWNSKYWRALIYVDMEQRRIFFSRHYPYKLPIEVEKQIIDCMLTRLGWENMEVRTDFSIGYLMEDFDYCEFLYERNYGNSSENTHLHYNDLRGFDGGHYCALSSADSEVRLGGYNSSYNRKKRTIIGAPVYCLKCEEHPVHGSSSYLCQHCDTSLSICADCGNPVVGDSDNALWLNDEEVVCGYCADNYEWCSYCECYHLVDDFRWNEHVNTSVCKDCNEEINKEHERFDEQMKEEQEEEEREATHLCAELPF